MSETGGDNLVEEMISSIRGAMNIIEVDAPGPFQALNTNDILNCAGGAMTVIVPDIEVAVKELTIDATDGTVTLTGNATIETPNIVTTGVKVTIYVARGQWWQK